MADADQSQNATIEIDQIPTRERKYRIAILGQDSGAWFTWRRIYRFDPDVHDEGHDPLEAARADLPRAQEDYPGREMRVEVLTDHGDSTSSWEEVA